jgi:hypothetical protein
MFMLFRKHNAMRNQFFANFIFSGDDPVWTIPERRMKMKRSGGNLVSRMTE